MMSSVDTSLQPSSGQYADLIEKYRPKYDATWAQKQAPAIIERVTQACATHTYAYLVGLRFPDNAFVREVFTRLTGIALHKTQRESLRIIREFVGAEAVAAYHQEAAKQHEERQVKRLEKCLYFREVESPSGLIPMSDFIQKLIADGHTSLWAKSAESLQRVFSPKTMEVAMCSVVAMSTNISCSCWLPLLKRMETRMPNSDETAPQLTGMHFHPLSYNSTPLEEARLYCCWHEQAPPDLLALRYQGIYALCSPAINDHPKECIALEIPKAFSVSKWELLYPREYYCKPELAAEAMVEYGHWTTQHRIEAIFGWRFHGDFIRSVATLERGAYLIWLTSGTRGILIDHACFAANAPLGGTYHVCCHYYPLPSYEDLFNRLYPDWMESVKDLEAIDAFFALRPSRIDLSQAHLQRKTLAKKTKDRQRCVIVSCFQPPRDDRYDWEILGDWGEAEIQQIEAYLLELRRFHPGAFFRTIKYERYVQLVCHFSKRKLFFEGKSVEQLIEQSTPLLTPSSEH